MHFKKFKNIKRGKVFNTKGELLGTHKGFPFYTIGQRKGLGISHSRPIYIKEIIPKKNIKDLVKINEKVKKELEVIPVDHMDDVIKIALQG